MLPLLLFVTCLLALASPAAAGWIEGTVIGVRDDFPTSARLYHMNTWAVPASNTPGVWLTLDLTPLGVPPDATAAFVAGILVITHGTTPALCHMEVLLRAPGNTDPRVDYPWQISAPHLGDGPRIPVFALVPLRAGRVELLWTRSTDGQWPDHCAYGMSLAVQGYVR